MRAWILAAASLLLAPGAGSAQVLSIAFHDGRVQLTAENVPVTRILAEWTRVGGTRIVNGERVPGGPVTLQLVDTPEQQAIDIILRNAAGYMVTGRETTAPAGASVLDKIMVLPTTTRAAATPAPLAPAPVETRAAAPVEGRVDPDADEPDAPAPGPGLPAGFPRTRVPVTAAPVGPRVQDGDGEQNPPTPPLTTPVPGNPFGVATGSSRPGTISPVQPPRPDNQQSR